MPHPLTDLIDLPQLQELLDGLCAVMPLATAVVDLQGSILTASGWLEICTGFHRTDSTTERVCRASHQRLQQKAGGTAAGGRAGVGAGRERSSGELLGIHAKQVRG